MRELNYKRLLIGVVLASVQVLGWDRAHSNANEQRDDNSPRWTWFSECVCSILNPFLPNALVSTIFSSLNCEYWLVGRPLTPAPSSHAPRGNFRRGCSSIYEKQSPSNSYVRVLPFYVKNASLARKGCMATGVISRYEDQAVAKCMKNNLKITSKPV